MIHQHEWKTTERRVSGVIIKFHGCVAKGCSDRELKAYDLIVENKNQFQGKYLVEKLRG